MREYHVCRCCFGIITRWKKFMGWSHVDKKSWFKSGVHVAQPDYPAL